MKKNMGSHDRIIRIAAAIIIAILYLTNQITGVAGIILGLVAILLVITSLISICPMYMLFGISTCKKKPE